MWTFTADAFIHADSTVSLRSSGSAATIATKSAVQRLRRAIMDENGGGTGVGAMRAMHKAGCSPFYFRGRKSRRNVVSTGCEFDASNAFLPHSSDPAIRIVE